MKRTPWWSHLISLGIGSAGLTRRQTTTTQRIAWFGTVALEARHHQRVVETRMQFLVIWTLLIKRRCAAPAVIQTRSGRDSAATASASPREPPFATAWCKAPALHYSRARTHTHTEPVGAHQPPVGLARAGLGSGRAADPHQTAPSAAAAVARRAGPTRPPHATGTRARGCHRCGRRCRATEGRLRRQPLSTLAPRLATDARRRCPRIGVHRWPTDGDAPRAIIALGGLPAPTAAAGVTAPWGGAWPDSLGHRLMRWPHRQPVSGPAATRRRAPLPVKPRLSGAQPTWRRSRRRVDGSLGGVCGGASRTAPRWATSGSARDADQAGRAATSGTTVADRAKTRGRPHVDHTRRDGVGSARPFDGAAARGGPRQRCSRRAEASSGSWTAPPPPTLTLRFPRRPPLLRVASLVEDGDDEHDASTCCQSTRQRLVLRRSQRERQWPPGGVARSAAAKGARRWRDVPRDASSSGRQSAPAGWNGGHHEQPYERGVWSSICLWGGGDGREAPPPPRARGSSGGSSRAPTYVAGEWRRRSRRDAALACALPSTSLPDLPRRDRRCKRDRAGAKKKTHTGAGPTADSRTHGTRRRVGHRGVTIGANVGGHYSYGNAPGFADRVDQGGAEFTFSLSCDLHIWGCGGWGGSPLPPPYSNDVGDRILAFVYPPRQWGYVPSP